MRVFQRLCAIFLFSASIASADDPSGQLVGETYDYAFSIPMQVAEIVTAACEIPCATPEVRDIELFLEGGFNVTGRGTVTGAGSIAIHGDPICRIISQGGAGAGLNCRVVGSKDGHFLVSGLRTGIKSPSGTDYAPVVMFKLEIVTQADLFVDFSVAGVANQYAVNHYQGSFTKLMTGSGLVGAPIEIQPMRGAEQHFVASFELPAPGFSREISAEATLSFYQSPFGGE